MTLLQVTQTHNDFLLYYLSSSLLSNPRDSLLLLLLFISQETDSLR